MRQRKLGSTGLFVSEVSFGAWQLGNRDDWAPMDDRAALRLVDEALDGGVNLFDTAPNYAATNSERLLGEALVGKRDGVVLVSKIGHRPEGPKDFSVDWFWQSLEGSLQRLRTDHLDVLLLHNPEPEMYAGTDPIWDALEQAREQGKIRHYGSSLDSSHEIETCLTHTGSEVLEIFFNILHQDVRRAFPLVQARGAGTIVKIPLDSGWLTGRYGMQSRFRGLRARWTAEQIERRAALVTQLDWLTADGSPLARKAIGFVLSYPEVGCVIPGARTSGQLRANLEAADHPITDADRSRLEAFWDEFTCKGERLLPW